MYALSYIHPILQPNWLVSEWSRPLSDCLGEQATDRSWLIVLNGARTTLQPFKKSRFSLRVGSLTQAPTHRVSQEPTIDTVKNQLSE